MASGTYTVTPLLLPLTENPSTTAEPLKFKKGTLELTKVPLSYIPVYPAEFGGGVLNS